MKVNLSELRAIVEGIILEAKKGKKAAAKENPLAGTAGGAFGSYAEVFDFSAPLGDTNLYKRQGQANWGPNTNTDDQQLPDKTSGIGDLDEAQLRSFVKSVMQESPELVESVWDTLAEAEKKVPESAWEKAAQYMDVEDHCDAPKKKK